MNDTVSAPNEALRIISDEDLEFAKYALSTRIPRKYHLQRKAEDEALPEDAQTCIVRTAVTSWSAVTAQSSAAIVLTIVPSIAVTTVRSKPKAAVGNRYILP